VESLYSRFIKSEEDAQASIAMHAANGITQVRLEGEFPQGGAALDG